MFTIVDLANSILHLNFRISFSKIFSEIIGCCIRIIKDIIAFNFVFVEIVPCVTGEIS